MRQLATEYLKRRQDELGCTIDPEDYPAELQRVKAYLALHNVYGVDLNATAVEFAEITLWLDTMAKGLDAPWFGLRLRRGNSLIGARRAVYREDEVTSKEWLRTPPTDVPLEDLTHRIEADDSGPTQAAGHIPHWLLPGAGWGATADSKQAKQLAPDRVAAVKKWGKQMRAKPTKAQVRKLVDISYQAEELWTMALRRLMVAEQQTRREIALWGREATTKKPTVTREQVEESLADSNGAYRRLRRVMDAWCALWFWPLTGEPVAPPTWEEWIDACQMIIGSQTQIRLKNTARRYDDAAQQQLAPADQWEALAEQENWAISAGGADSVDNALERHPWLRVCEKVAKEQGFFHWQLDFAPVFGRGGFDLQVGNPPWVRPDSDIDALLAEGDPWWELVDKPSEAEKRERRTTTLLLPGIRELTTASDSETVAVRSFVSDPTMYPELDGLRPDLYRCFMCTTWSHQSSRGTVGLIHPETHLTDEKAGHLRELTYPRLRRHWQFVNELQLFSEIDHHVTYGVHIYGSHRAPSFLNVSNLYTPATVIGSLRHDGSGEAPGFKFEGHWDDRPHGKRIQTVTDETLATWRDILDPDLQTPRQTRMLYTVNRDVAETLRQLSRAPRLASLHLRFSQGWNETTDFQKEYFVKSWGQPDSWDDVILQGPHLHVATPFFKSPNRTMKHNQDWSEVDLETLPPGAIPVTAYKPAGDRARYDADYTHWDGDPARDHYRLAWRAMAANTGGERSYPPSFRLVLRIPTGCFVSVEPLTGDSPQLVGSVQVCCWTLPCVQPRRAGSTKAS